jgi:ankyrin repeat protein
MDLYAYEPLDLEECSFRLIRLFKGSYGPIHCELFRASLHSIEDGIDYEALSYTWGSAEKPYEIETDGKKFPVAKNLFQALEHLRLQHQDRILWIDAICIDQSNIDERGHQVRQMSSIYQRAEQVIVWLGQPTVNTDLFFHYMQCLEKEAVGHACINWKNSDGRWQLLWSNIRLLWNDLNQDAQREGFEDLLQRPWFRRVWIVQEVANARSAKIMCGKKLVSTRIFTVAPILLGITPDSHCQAILDIMPGPSRRYSWWSGSRDLRTLLLKFRQSEATDPRDNIYALLGIQSGGCRTALLVPDYNRSLEDVIHDTVTFLLDLGYQGSAMAAMPKWNWAEFSEILESLENAVASRAVENNQYSIAELLLKTGKISVEVKDQHEQKSLLWAAEIGDVETFERLLRESKADINWKDQHGTTTLARAASRGNIRTVQLLLNTSTVDLNSKDRWGQTPLSEAASSGNIGTVQLLLDTSKVDLNSKSQWGDTPLSEAARQGHKAVVRLLLNTGKVDLDFEDGLSNMPLLCAAENGHKEVVEILLKTGKVDINLKDSYGQTAVSRAAEKGHKEVVETLLKTGKVDVDSWDNYEKTALLRAERNGHEEIVKLLREPREVDSNPDPKDVPKKALLSWVAKKGKKTVNKLRFKRGETYVN